MEHTEQDNERIAAQIIADAREQRRTDPANNGAQPYGADGPANGDAFDHWVATEGWHEYGIFYNAAYALANPRTPAPADPLTDDQLAARAQERKDRAAALWQRVRPYIRAFYEDCRAARYTGWAMMSDGPVRRVRQGHTPITVPMAAAIEHLESAQAASREAEARQQSAAAERDEAIRGAFAADVPPSVIMERSSLSRARIYQVRDGHR